MPGVYFVVSGAPGSGESLNKQAIMEHYACTECHDGATCETLKTKGKRVLVLTGQEGFQVERAGYLVANLHIGEVKEALGKKWKEPVENRASRLAPLVTHGEPLRLPEWTEGLSAPVKTALLNLLRDSQYKDLEEMLCDKLTAAYANDDGVRINLRTRQRKLGEE
jgi:hypothetical protein